MSFLREFREFAVKGNAVDMAVGIVLGAELPAVAIRYGLLVNTVIEFLIIVLTVFVVVKIMNRIIRAREATGN